MDTFAIEESQSKRTTGKIRVGVLSFHNSKETKAILNAIAALGYTPVWLRETNAQTWVENGTIHLDPDVDIVVNRLLLTKADRPLENLEVAASYETARPMLNVSSAVMQTMHKYGAAARLAAAGLPVPNAYMAFSHQTINDDELPLDGKTVHKPAIGTNGGGLSLVDAADVIPPRIAHRRALLQEFLDTDADPPSDIRIYVVGDRIVGAMKRYAPPGEWRTNVALGGDVEDMTDDLPREAEQIARHATAVFDLDYAGVDLLFRDETWYVLEVNATAGFKGLYEATGRSPAPYIAQLAINRLGGSTNEEHVTELASVLDDSIPECKPNINSGPETKQTVGYTEPVIVSGGQEFQRVTAKADTGAQRTNVDIEVAAAVGAGPLTGTTRVKSGSHTTSQTRPLVNLDIKLGDQWHRVSASLEDRSHMTYPVLLGRDILTEYYVDAAQRTTEE